MILLLLLSLASASEIWLRVGESRLLPAPAAAEVRIGTRGVVRAVDADEGVRLIGLKPGTTSLSVNGHGHLVRVSFGAQKDFARELRALMSEMMGLEVPSFEKDLEVRGTLLRLGDWLEIAELARKHHGQYRFRARALPDVAREALEHLHGLARARGYPILRFSADPQFTAHLPKTAKALKPAVSEIFAPLGVHVTVSETQLEIEPLVRTRVILAEVSKSFAREFGISWPEEYEARVVPKLAGEDTLVARLRALESSGQAQVLASPTLLCRSGGHARFHAGGEFPIRMISRNSREVTWRPHGVILNVKPRADFQGAISLEIETEISLLDMEGAVDGVPAVRKNSVRSHFDLPGKRTIALSGLVRQELGRGEAGLPWLTSLPVLGSLFSSKKFLTRQSELVVFVTPEVASADEDARIEMPAGWVNETF